MKRIRRIARQKKLVLKRLARDLGAGESPPQVLLCLETAILCCSLILAFTKGRTIVFDTLGAHADAWVIAACPIVLLVLELSVNRRVAIALERRFSSDSYNDRQILFDLGQAARGVTTIDELFKLVVDRIEAALRVTNVSIFVRDDATSDFVCRMSSDQVLSQSGKTSALSPAGRAVLPGNAFVTKRLSNLSTPLGLEPHEFSAWNRALANAPTRVREAREREISTLQRLHSRLLSQIQMRGELIGIISVGPKANGRSFTVEDKKLVRSVAGQLAFIIEHFQMVGRMMEEERLRRELALATEVQQRLFPEKPPVSGSVDLCGFCQPAREVGGDYYDFLELGNGQIGVAVADVAGKGMAAALLMSIIQASLRSQVTAESQITKERDSLSDLAWQINRLLWRSTSTSSYATFFYAQFDEVSRRLTYVNAGHNAPIWGRLRQPGRESTQTSLRYSTSGNRLLHRTGFSGGAMSAVLDEQALDSLDETIDCDPAIANPVSVETEWTELSVGGVALGLFDNQVYDQQTVQMIKGDLFFAYTDGLTEALNLTGEEFGETRLKRILAASLGLGAEAIRDRVIEGVRTWCQGTPQHDDMTFVVMKVN
jgi:sigma-B regulation protein RsbU (phosphoserine phosphatase)